MNGQTKQFCFPSMKNKMVDSAKVFKNNVKLSAFSTGQIQEVQHREANGLLGRWRKKAKKRWWSYLTYAYVYVDACINSIHPTHFMCIWVNVYFLFLNNEIKVSPIPDHMVSQHPKPCFPWTFQRTTCNCYTCWFRMLVQRLGVISAPVDCSQSVKDTFSKRIWWSVTILVCCSRSLTICDIPPPLPCLSKSGRAIFHAAWSLSLWNENWKETTLKNISRAIKTPH